MSKMSCDQACALAAFVLADGKQEMTEANLEKVVSAAGVKVCPSWVKVFAQYLATKNPMDLIAQLGSAQAAPAAAAAAPAQAQAQKEKTEEEQIVGGFAFGGDSSSSEEESS